MLEIPRCADQDVSSQSSARLNCRPVQMLVRLLSSSVIRASENESPNFTTSSGDCPLAQMLYFGLEGPEFHGVVADSPL